MRLFDKVATQAGNFGRSITADFAMPGSGVLCADAIAHYYSDTPRSAWHSEMYPHSTPPWERFFVEWNEPTTWRNSDGVRVTRGPHQEQVAVVGVIYREQKEVARQLKEIAKTGDVGAEIISQTTMIVSAIFILWHEGMVKPLDCQTFWLLKSDGWVLCHFVQGPALTNHEDAKELSRALGSFNHVAMLAFTFANCANVKLEDQTEELAPIPKIRRRLKLPEVKRYTLNIQGHSTHRRESTGDPQEGIMPFHLCRGHFATYTEKAPLFGKYVGKYWIPPHTKGKKERGEVIKDYKIVDRETVTA